MAADLAQVQREVDEATLENAIDTNDRAAIAASLRILSHQNLSQKLLNKLADYIDPAKERPLYKCGPKPRKHLNVIRYSPVVNYKFLCENKELARILLQEDEGNEAFHIIEGSDLWDDDGNFTPAWKYPHRRRDREAVPPPKRGEIKDFVCKTFGIGTRTFDELQAEYNKK